jgi:hypothetical protein
MAKAYGSIPHLPGSKPEQHDKFITQGQARICCEKSRQGDIIILQEKLDGSCCAVANVDGVLYPLTRAGNLAWESSFEQHRMFAIWFEANRKRFEELLEPGYRIVGEWLVQAHGTIYKFDESIEPFVVFDIMIGVRRLAYSDFIHRINNKFNTPPLLHYGSEPISIERALELIKTPNYGTGYQPEGAVWRVEHNGNVDYLVKYIRNDFVPGRYLPCYTGRPPVWNISPKEFYANYNSRKFI